MAFFYADDDSNKFWKFDESCLKYISRAGSSVWKKLTLKKISHVFWWWFQYVLQVKFDEIWKNVEISWYFKGPALSAFFYEISQLLWMGSNFTCMFLMMIQINLMKVWWKLVTFEKMLKFNHISRAGTVGIFLWKKLTSLKRLKFHMHVSDDDSNMFCKFDEIWWILKKCWNFMIFLGAGTVCIFLWNFNACFWMILWMGSNFMICAFLMMIQICFCKFDEIWWKKCWNLIRDGAGTVAFFYEISRQIFLWNKLTSLNGLKFHMHVSDDDSNMFCKFDEI